MIIRRMVENDCLAVAELEKRIFSLPWSEQGFLDAITGTQNIFLVAQEDGEICGYAGLYQSMDEGEITNVAVASQKRNRGIGRMLMQKMIEEAKLAGISQIILEVRVSNTSAIHLYETCGFVNCGVRKGFYEFPKEDAYIMRADC